MPFASAVPKIGIARKNIPLGALDSPFEPGFAPFPVVA